MNNVLLTAEQAQQIEDALFGCRPTVISHENWNDVYKARAIITAAKAQEQDIDCPCGSECIKCSPRVLLAEQAEQDPLIDYERINALREGEQNGAEDAYFFARPENDTPSLRKMFCQGFERGFHKGLKYIAPVRTKDLTDIEYLQDAVTKALKKAFHLGQTYWQQADSESYAANKKADVTQELFFKLKDDTRAVIAADRELNRA